MGPILWDTLYTVVITYHSKREGKGSLKKLGNFPLEEGPTGKNIFKYF